MKKQTSAGFPLSKEDVFTLRGEPSYKLVKEHNHSLRRQKEEWVYVQEQKEEHFIFLGKQLARYSINK